MINCIRNSILKHRDNVLRRQSIETVAEKMLSIAATTIDVIEKTVDSSPMRVISFCSLTYLSSKFVMKSWQCKISMHVD